ncbi:hypothetical protein MKI79_06520 [Acinetobacter sp. A3.8]|uniref:Uncharacterized protein n=1 Tax=Acinetobacter sedimenti TaxID=2919922 RepID=A0A9X1WZY8_9GAMM|nr:hypothetical protein [Acinetobacter sedimenti]MCJ8146555.1 hypothetical protein [Acinetobacter sedimenti]
MKGTIFIGLSALLFSSLAFSQDDYSKFRCNLKKFGENNSISEVHIVEIPKNTESRFNIIYDGRSELAQSYDYGNGIRWGYGAELNHLTSEYLFGGGSEDILDELRELREASEDGGIVWNFDFKELKLQESFDDGDERGMGAQILKEGSCEKVGFKPTKIYTDLVDRVEYYTQNYARDYHKKIFTDKNPLHSSYRLIATEKISGDDGTEQQANMLVDFAPANYWNKDDSRPYYKITFMAKLFNSKVGDSSLKPINDDSQYITAFVKCNVNPHTIRFTELYNNGDYDDRGYNRSQVRFNFDEQLLINYACAFVDAVNKADWPNP